MIVPINIVGCAVGAFVLYCKLRSEDRPVIEFITYVAPEWNSQLRQPSEMAVYTAIGSLISYGFVHPITFAQAVSAGLGWTGLISAFPRNNNTNNQPIGGNSGNP